MDAYVVCVGVGRAVGVRIDSLIAWLSVEDSTTVTARPDAFSLTGSVLVNVGAVEERTLEVWWYFGRGSGLWMVCGGDCGVSGDTGLRRGPIDAKEKRKLESRFENLRGDFMVNQIVFENESVLSLLW